MSFSTLNGGVFPYPVLQVAPTDARLNSYPYSFGFTLNEMVSIFYGVKKWTATGTGSSGGYDTQDFGFSKTEYNHNYLLWGDQNLRNNQEGYAVLGNSSFTEIDTTIPTMGSGGWYVQLRIYNHETEVQSILFDGTLYYPYIDFTMGDHDEVFAKISNDPNVSIPPLLYPNYVCGTLYFFGKSAPLYVASSADGLLFFYPIAFDLDISVNSTW